jgi:ABC-type sulfate transport system substrate-binding protein
VLIIFESEVNAIRREYGRSNLEAVQFPSVRPVSIEETFDGWVE